MEREWQALAGVVNFWVCGGGMSSWYPDGVKMLKARGDTVWTYGGTPAVTEPSSHISLEILRAWIQGNIKLGGRMRVVVQDPTRICVSRG